MNYQESSNFNKKRNFYEIHEEAIRVLKKLFKPITIAIVLIPGPLLLLVGGLNGYIDSLGIDLNFLLKPENKAEAIQKFNQLLPYFVPLITLNFMVSVIYAALVNRYLILHQQFSISFIGIKELLSHMTKDAWRLFYNYLIFGLIALLVLFPVLILISLFPGLMILLFVALILTGPIFYFAIKNASYLILRDEIPMMNAFLISFNYAKKKWWLIWGIVVSSVILIGILSMVFTLPKLVYNSMLAFSGINPNLAFLAEHTEIWNIVFGIVSVFGQYTLLPAINIIFVLTFYAVSSKEEI
jgi:hypothetical protein